ncbi:hypothetical protein K0M31_002639, partial [Melipona bicolor]
MAMQPKNLLEAQQRAIDSDIWIQEMNNPTTPKNNKSSARQNSTSTNQSGDTNQEINTLDNNWKTKRRTRRKKNTRRKGNSDRTVRLHYRTPRTTSACPMHATWGMSRQGRLLLDTPEQ